MIITTTAGTNKHKNNRTGTSGSAGTEAYSMCDRIREAEDQKQVLLEDHDRGDREFLGRREIKNITKTMERTNG